MCGANRTTTISVNPSNASAIGGPLPHHSLSLCHSSLLSSSQAAGRCTSQAFSAEVSAPKGLPRGDNSHYGTRHGGVEHRWHGITCLHKHGVVRGRLEGYISSSRDLCRQTRLDFRLYGDRIGDS
jgi:hypothetical protein